MYISYWAGAKTDEVRGLLTGTAGVKERPGIETDCSND